MPNIFDDVDGVESGSQPDDGWNTDDSDVLKNKDMLAPCLSCN